MPGAHSALDRALLLILCHSPLPYDPARERHFLSPGRAGVSGLFSQLNYLTQQILTRAYLGRGPVVGSLHALRLQGYGGSPMSEVFRPYSCGPPPADGEHAQALATVLGAPRHLVVSHLMHLTLRPHGRHAPKGSGSFDLAIHVRRGDKLLDNRTQERIATWDEDGLFAAVTKEVGATSGTSGGSASVLVASDDDAFAASLSSRLRTAGYAVTTLGNDQAKFDAQKKQIEAVEAHI